MARPPASLPAAAAVAAEEVAAAVEEEEAAPAVVLAVAAPGRVEVSPTPPPALTGPMAVGAILPPSGEHTGGRSPATAVAHRLAPA